jgi:hypothetical protein
LTEFIPRGSTLLRMNFSMIVKAAMI